MSTNNVVDCNILRANTLRFHPGPQVYTPTFVAFTLGTATINFTYTIVDRVLFLQGTIIQTAAGTQTGSEYQISLPAGVTGRVGVAGTAYITNGTDSIVGVCRISSGTSFVVTFNDPASASPLPRRWGVVADCPANLLFNTNTVNAFFNLQVFISPASAILAGTL